MPFVLRERAFFPRSNSTNPSAITVASDSGCSFAGVRCHRAEELPIKIVPQTPIPRSCLWPFGGRKLGIVRGRTDSEVILLKESKQ